MSHGDSIHEADTVRVPIAHMHPERSRANTDRLDQPFFAQPVPAAYADDEDQEPYQDQGAYQEDELAPPRDRRGPVAAVVLAMAIVVGGLWLARRHLPALVHQVRHAAARVQAVRPAAPAIEPLPDVVPAPVRPAAAVIARPAAPVAPAADEDAPAPHRRPAPRRDVVWSDRAQKLVSASDDPWDSPQPRKTASTEEAAASAEAAAPATPAEEPVREPPAAGPR